MKKFNTLAITIFRLGFADVANAFIYRLKLRSGYLKYIMRSQPIPAGQRFFLSATPSIPLELSASVEILDRADRLLVGQHKFFSNELVDIGSPPDWFKFYKSETERHWTETSINETPGNDIKRTWEVSRFHWAPVLATAFAFTKEPRYLIALEDWIEDWSDKNNIYVGPNWGCAQEASIRVLNLLNSACILEQHNEPQKGLYSLIYKHCERIFPTLQYSISQANNHGIVESIALLVGGSWLGRHANNQKERTAAKKFEYRGGEALRVLLYRLVLPDGGFSMYSINYHRVVLDALSSLYLLSELINLGDSLPLNYQSTFRKLTSYFEAFVVGESGDSPNMGANDGTSLLASSIVDFRDFRTSLLLARYCCDVRKNAFREELISARHILLSNFEFKYISKQMPSLRSEIFNNSGCAVLKHGNRVSVFFLFPNYKFRPSHSDALHLDLWVDGLNILRDGGTYSYNPVDAETFAYFAGTESHNTVQFDDRDQMPRISRFLFGDWLKTCTLEKLESNAIKQTFAAGYRDRHGCTHVRRVALQSSSLRVADEVKGFKHKAIMRWRLEPGNWRLDGCEVHSGSVSLKVQASVPIKRIELVQGWESRYYLHKTPLPVLEVEVDQPGELVTEINWELA